MLMTNKIRTMEFITVGERRYNLHIIRNAKMLMYRYTGLRFIVITDDSSTNICHSEDNPLYRISGEFIKISYNGILRMLVNRKYVNDIVHLQPLNGGTLIKFKKPLSDKSQIEIDIDIPTDTIVDAFTRQLEADCIEDLEEPLSHVKKDIQAFLIGD